MSSIKPLDWRPSDAARESLSSEGLSLIKLLQVIRRRKWMILGIFAATSAATFATVSQMPPRYTAEAVIMIQPRKSQVLDVKSGIPQVAVDASTIRTEAEVLRSLDLAEKVAAKLNLIHDLEFMSRPGRVASFVGSVDVAAVLPEWVRTFLLAQPWTKGWFAKSKPAAPVDEPPLPSMQDVIDRLQDNLGISNDGRSAIIKIRYDTADPKLGTAIVNTYASTYIEEQLAAKSEAIVRAGVLLNQRVEELRETVLDSDRAVQTFRDENRLTEARGMTVTAQQLAETNTQLTLAAAERSQKESNLDQLLTMVRAGKGADAAMQIMASPAILQLKTQQTEVLRREAALTSMFDVNYPALKNIANEKKELQDKVDGEMNNIVVSLTNEVEAERARERALKNSLAELEERAHEQDQAQVHLKQMEREANANHELYEHFLTRAKETSVQKYFEEADARILSAALVPKNPTFPQTSRIVGLASFASLFGALALALLLEKVDHTFVSVDDLEREADAMSFGMIPEIARGRGNPRMVIEYPTSAFSEAVRWVRTSLDLAMAKRAKVVMVTSSVSREGKTTLSASLGRSAAQSGQRALLIDCDLRLGRIGKVFEASGTLGLEALIGGEADDTDVIRTDAESGLDYITASLGTANPQALLGSVRMDKLLQRMRERYDLVILDAPPVLAVSDALVIAKMADATIVIVRWNVTPRSSALKALRELRKVGGNVVGVVLTRVDLRKNKANGFQSPEPYYYSLARGAPVPSPGQPARVAERSGTRDTLDA